MVARGKRPQVAPPLEHVRKIPAPCRGAMILASAERTSFARFAGWRSLGGVIPGLRSSRYIGTPHPGLHSVAAPRLVDATTPIDSLASWRYHFDATLQLVGPGAGYKNPNFEIRTSKFRSHRPVNSDVGITGFYREILSSNSRSTH